MKPFKVGDKVRFVGPYANAIQERLFTIGIIYEVLDIVTRDSIKVRVGNRNVFANPKRFRRKLLTNAERIKERQEELNV